MTYGPQPEPPGQPQQPQYQAQQPASFGGPSPAWQAQAQAKGFLGALFDFSFNHFVTQSVMKLLYILGLAGIILDYIFALIFAFTASTFFGVLVLVSGPFIAIVQLAFWRVILEFFLGVARMSDDIHHGRFPGNR